MIMSHSLCSKSLFHLKSCLQRSLTTNRPFPVLPDYMTEMGTEDAENALHMSNTALEQLRLLKKTCLHGGGQKGIDRHVKLNKKVLARDRVRQLLDPGTEFFELCMTAGLGLEYGDVPAGGIVSGVGKIHGCDVMVVANDGTVKGGTFYPITITKQLRLQEIARQNRLPCLAVVDTGGAFLPLQADIFLPGGRSFGNQAIMSSDGIQQVALVSGLCTAGGAYAPTMSDVAIITHKIGNIYLGGPPLVKAATGEVVSAEELGGATMHCTVSGITDHFAATEEESFTITRDVVASLNLDPTPDLIDGEEPLYSCQGFEILAGMKNLNKTDVLAIISRLTDGSRFFEFKQLFGENLVAGFGYLQGQLVGLLGNSGPISSGDAQKGGHFVQLCDNRDIPIIFLQNSSCSGGELCDGKTMKERAKFIQTQSTVRVPKITLNVGGVAADENYTMCGPSFDPRFYMMWPSAAISKSDPTYIPDPLETPTTIKQKRKLSQFEFQDNSSAWAAARTLCDIVLEPKETRSVLSRAVQVAMFQHVSMRQERGVGRSVVRM